MLDPDCITPRLIARFWTKVDRSGGPDECWPWTASTYRNGYGQFGIGRAKVFCSHRIAWELTHGPIPDTLTVDHLCKNRLCQNPAHMEIVTRGENSLRGTSPAAQNKRKTVCKHGHRFTPSNTYVDKNGGRACRVCHRINEARRRERNALHSATIVH